MPTRSSKADQEQEPEEEQVQAQEPEPETVFFRHIEYPNITKHLPGVGPVQFQSHFYSTSDPTEIAALRKAGGGIMEDDGVPEYRCPVEGCSFVTTKSKMLAAHKRTAHQGG